jgi:hypothetical protein
MIVDFLGFSIGDAPLIYLVIRIFRHKPKVSYLQGFANKIKCKMFLA